MLENTLKSYWLERKITKKLAKAAKQSEKHTAEALAYIAGDYLDMSDKEVVVCFRNNVLNESIDLHEALDNNSRGYWINRKITKKLAVEFSTSVEEMAESLAYSGGDYDGKPDKLVAEEEREARSGEAEFDNSKLTHYVVVQDGNAKLTEDSNLFTDKMVVHHSLATGLSIYVIAVPGLYSSAIRLASSLKPISRSAKSMKTFDEVLEWGFKRGLMLTTDPATLRVDTLE